MNLRGNHLAVSIDSLARVETELFRRVLAARIDVTEVIEVQVFGPPVRAVAFRDDLHILSAAIAVDVVRSENRRAETQEIDVYLLRERGDVWVKIPAREVLTIQVNGKYILNQRIFGTQSSEDLVAPEPLRQRVTGKSIIN